MQVTCTHWYLQTQEIFTSLDAALKKYSLRYDELCKSPIEMDDEKVYQRFTHPCYRIECTETLSNIFNYLETHLIPVVETTDWLGRVSPLMWPIGSRSLFLCR
jgi:hypothetical protein